MRIGIGSERASSANMQISTNEISILAWSGLDYQRLPPVLFVNKVPKETERNYEVTWMKWKRQSSGGREW